MKKLLLKLLELLSNDIRQKTGERAIVSGVWRSKDEYIALTAGERFPPLGDMTWRLVVSVS
jgi:hypothetical protein